MKGHPALVAALVCGQLLAITLSACATTTAERAWSPDNTRETIAALAHLSDVELEGIAAQEGHIEIGSKAYIYYALALRQVECASTDCLNRARWWLNLAATTPIVWTELHSQYSAQLESLIFTERPVVIEGLPEAQYLLECLDEREPVGENLHETRLTGCQHSLTTAFQSEGRGI